MTGDESVERIDECVSVSGSKKTARRASESQLREKRNAAACVAGYRSSVAQDEPPAVVPLRLGDVCEQLGSCVVGKREKRQLLPTIEPRDDTRRESAEPSGARVEQDRTRQP